MPTTSLVKQTLGLSVPFNMLAAYLLAFPASAPAQLVELPTPVPALYTALTAFLVVLFGAMYAWMAIQEEVPRQFLFLGIIGKTGVFVIAAALWLASANSGRLVLLASGDLAFAMLWLSWLRSNPAT